MAIWITNDEEVKSQIPETDRSTKVVKTFEAEPQSSSIHSTTQLECGHRQSHSLSWN